MQIAILPYNKRGEHISNQLAFENEFKKFCDILAKINVTKNDLLVSKFL
jgi:hypothetical protein